MREPNVCAHVSTTVVLVFPNERNTIFYLVSSLIYSSSWQPLFYQLASCIESSAILLISCAGAGLSLQESSAVLFRLLISVSCFALSYCTIFVEAAIWILVLCMTLLYVGWFLTVYAILNIAILGQLSVSCF